MATVGEEKKTDDETRTAQLIAAVEFCKDQQCRGYKALQTGRFPLIKFRHTIDNILDGKSKYPIDLVKEEKKKDDERAKCTKSLVHRTVYQEKIETRRAQLIAAVELCKEQRCRGYKALQTGRFPLIKSRHTIDNILDGKSKHPIHSKEYCSVLTTEEEATITSYVVNKARAYQPVNRKLISDRVLAMLRLREKTNQNCKGGRKFKKLSPAAKQVLSTGKLSRKFWERYDTKNRGVIRKKRRGSTSMKRVLSCTKEMATEHIDELAMELVRCGILTNEKKEESGTWTGAIDSSRVFNHDETPQFINYGVDGSANNVFYSGKGERCTAARTENRECVTITPMVSLSGDILICHVIFSSAGLKSNMAPREAVTAIDNLLVSSTENGFITGKACLEFYKVFDSYLTKKDIKRPVVVLTDGHSSRYDLEVLRFCQEKEILQFVSPPDTTGLLQPLDQINSMLHSSYRECAEKYLKSHEHLDRESFMKILAEIWPTWASTDAVKKSFKRCGITETNLDTNLMQKDKFVSAELLTASEPDKISPTTPAAASSPVGIKKGTAAYWRRKYLSMVDTCSTLLETPITPDEIPELTRIDKVKARKSKNFRITQTCGSLAAKDILSRKEELEAQEIEKQAASDQRKELKEKSRTAFLKCKDRCICVNSDVCEALGLKQCPYCKDVMRSQCSKSQCRTASGAQGKPIMILCDQSGKVEPKRKKNTEHKKKPKKTKYDEIYGDSSGDSSDNEDETVDDCSSYDEPSLDLQGQICEFWKSISPPVDESSIKGKWFAAIYKNGSKTSVYVGRALRRFLVDEGGAVSHLELDCLKPRIGNDNILDAYPQGQEDKYLYPIADVLGGPLNVSPVPRKRSWRVADLGKIESFYEKVKNEDREEWVNEFRASHD